MEQVGRPEQRAAHALGFLTAAIAVLGVAALGAVLGAGLDPALLGYMGLAPLSFGLYLLISRLRSRGAGSSSERPPSIEAAGSGWLATSLLMFSNSADSLAIFFPLLVS